jgi:hypothetical protein
MGTGGARVSVWGKLERKKKNSKLGFVAGFLYGGRMCLVTLPRKEEAPARGEEEHAVVLSSMRTKRMRMTPPSVILAKGYGGLGLAAAGLRCWTRLLGHCWAVSAGKVQVSLLSYIPFIYFLFYFLF